MKLILFSIFDAKMAEFSSPFFEKKENAAVRNFSDWVNDGSDPRNMLFKHSADYVLWRIGEFDTETGVFESMIPVSVVSGSALKRGDTPPPIPQVIN